MIYSYVDNSTGNTITASNIKPEAGHKFIYNGTSYILSHVVNNVAYYNKKVLNQAIENNFMYHAPKEGQPEKYEQIRAKAKELAYLIDELCPKTREQSLANTNLEQAVFWANASIARN